MSPPPSQGSSRLLTRRRALGLLGAGAAGLLATGRPGRDATTEIATVAWRDRALETVAVPTAWYERERRARTALAAARERFADAVGVAAVTLGSAGEAVAGLPTSSVDVHVAPEADDPGVPEAVEGVPGRVVEAVTPAFLDGDGGDAESGADADTDTDAGPAPVGGAATLRAPDGATATATGAVDWQGERYLLTCAHLFQGPDGGCDGVVGTAVRDGDGARIGEVATADLAQDWALVAVDDGVRTRSAVAGVDAEVCGRVTTDGLQYLKARGIEVHKRGHATPERRGTVENIGVVHGGCDLGDGLAGDGYVAVDVPGVEGDSGGPVYHRFAYNGRAYLALVGLVSARVDWIRASSAAAIHREHGVAFGPSYSPLG